MARAISLRAWRTTTAAKIQAVGSSHPPSFAAFSRDAAALWAMYPAMSPDLAAKSAAAAQLSRSALHSYHNTGVFTKNKTQSQLISMQILANHLQGHLCVHTPGPDEHFLLIDLLLLCYKTTDL